MSRVPDLKPHHFSKTISISTRWSDNDIYQHVNNVVYFSFFDTAVNQNLLEQGVLSIEHSDIVGLVVNNQCQFFAPIAFPDIVHVGINVEKIGNTSVTYSLGIFKNNEDCLSALGSYTHAYVDRKTQRPIPIPAKIRALFETMLFVK